MKQFTKDNFPYPVQSIAIALRAVFYFFTIAICLLSLQSNASSNLCRTLFQNSFLGPEQKIKLKTLYPSLIKSRREFDQQIMKGVSVKQVQLTQTAQIKGLLHFMNLELNKSLSLDLDPKILSLKGQLEVAIKELQRDINSEVENSQISYSKYFNLSRRFSFAMNFRHTSHGKNYDNPFSGASETMKLAEYHLQEIGRQDAEEVGESVTNMMPHFVLPIKEDLNIKAVNDLLVMGIAPLGVTTVVQFVDGTKYIPSSFFKHDYIHSILFKKGPQVQLAALKFYRSFETFVRSTPDNKTRVIRRQLWFFAFHEEMPDLESPNAFRKSLEQLRSTDYMLDRFEDPQDLGSSFDGKVTTRNEILTQIRKTLEFLDSSYPATPE